MTHCADDARQKQLGLDDAWPAGLHGEGLKRGDCRLWIMRIGDHAHARLHLLREKIDEDITAPPAIEEMHMGIIRQKKSDVAFWAPVRLQLLNIGWFL